MAGPRYADVDVVFVIVAHCIALHRLQAHWFFHVVHVQVLQEFFHETTDCAGAARVAVQRLCVRGECGEFGPLGLEWHHDVRHDRRRRDLAQQITRVAVNARSDEVSAAASGSAHDFIIGRFCEMKSV